jgi:glycine reductase
VKVVHYINQFFAGVGGEEEASRGPEVRDGALGPGRKIASLIGPAHQIVATVFCGDDYAASTPTAAKEILSLIREAGAELVACGPAFSSGRYGIACGHVAAAAANAGIPALAAMHPENPGADDAAPAPVVAVGESARKMGPALEAMAGAIGKLAAGEKLETAGDPTRGPRRNRVADATSAARAVALALARLRGEQAETEIPLPDFGKVKPATPIAEPAKATIALLTEGALVPVGNPDRLESARAKKWLRYSLDGVDALQPGKFQSVHGGFSTVAANENPNRILPLDVARELEREGKIGRVHTEYMVTAGNGTSVADASRFGAEWAAELHKAGVQAAILTST